MSDAFLGPCSCADEGRCKHNEHGPLCMQEDSGACPYCTSDNEAIRDTYYDQTCEGCVKRMGR